MKKSRKPNRQPDQRRSGAHPVHSARFRNSAPQKLSTGGKLPPAKLPPGRIVVGLHAVNELLRVRGSSVTHLWLRENFGEHPDLQVLCDRAKAQKVAIHLHHPSVLDRIISSHQGVLAFTDEYPELDWSGLRSAQRAVLVALDEVEDPHNLGAVMRTAWLLGAQGILTPESRAAHLSPAVSKVAQGACEHVPVDRDTALPQTLKRLKDMGFWIYGMSHEAQKNIYSMELPDKVVWVLGSESSGLRKSVAGACDEFVTIPQIQADASYNVSVAAAIALGETYRQHHRTQ